MFFMNGCVIWVLLLRLFWVVVNNGLKVLKLGYGFWLVILLVVCLFVVVWIWCNCVIFELLVVFFSFVSSLLLFMILVVNELVFSGLFNRFLLLKGVNKVWYFFIVCMWLRWIVNMCFVMLWFFLCCGGWLFLWVNLVICLNLLIICCLCGKWLLGFVGFVNLFNFEWRLLRLRLFILVFIFEVYECSCVFCYLFFLCVGWINWWKLVVFFFELYCFYCKVFGFFWW